LLPGTVDWLEELERARKTYEMTRASDAESLSTVDIVVSGLIEIHLAE